MGRRLKNRGSGLQMENHLKLKAGNEMEQMFFVIYFYSAKASTALMISPTRLFCIYENRLICLFLFTSIKDIELLLGSG